MQRIKNTLPRALLTLLLFCLFGGAGADRARAEESLLIFAAASTTNFVREVNRNFSKATGIKVRGVFAASSTLAKQIAAGAPADVYISANLAWMKWLKKKGMVNKKWVTQVLANRLVLIAAKGAGVGPVNLAAKGALLKALGNSRLAMGDPGHVPAGMYGAQALKSLKLWPSLKNRIAAAATVRAALALVERGGARLGVVYDSDTVVSRKVVIVAKFPPKSHNPIVYPVAMVKGRQSAAARQYIRCLKTPMAWATARRWGFTPIK